MRMLGLQRRVKIQQPVGYVSEHFIVIFRSKRFPSKFLILLLFKTFVIKFREYYCSKYFRQSVKNLFAYNLNY